MIYDVFDYATIYIYIIHVGELNCKGQPVFLAPALPIFISWLFFQSCQPKLCFANSSLIENLAWFKRGFLRSCLWPSAEQNIYLSAFYTWWLAIAFLLNSLWLDSAHQTPYIYWLFLLVMDLCFYGIIYISKIYIMINIMTFGTF